MGRLSLFRPSKSRPWDRRLARHLLDRAGFGGSLAEIDELVALGPAEAVAKLVGWQPSAPDADFDFADGELDPAELRALPEAERRQRVLVAQRHARQAVGQLKGWWLRRMIASEQPLEEKLTLFWHGHFTSEADKVKNARLLFEQNQSLRRNAKGSLEAMLYDICRDPAMLLYLDNHLNRKGRPNENFARELLELFTLGIGHYTEADVLDTARAFTGWTLGRSGRARLGVGQFEYVDQQHDHDPKTVLGTTGDLNGRDIVPILLAQPSTAEFIVGKLWRQFVNDTIADQDADAIRSLAEVYRAAGYRLEPMLEVLFRSELFYDERHLGARIKSPAELIAGTARRLGWIPEPRQAEALALGLRALGQDLFDPPNVAGWGGGQEWINTSTLLQRYNLLGALLYGNLTGRGGRPARGVQTVALETPEATAAPELIAWVEDAFLAVPLAAEQRDALGGHARVVLTSQRGDEAYRAMLHLVMSTPHYQVC